MSFTPGIPTTGQSLGATKIPIMNNFSAINTTISVDHVPMNDGNQGKHNKSTYVAQGSDPTPAADEIDIYSKSVVYPAPISATVVEEFLIRNGGSPIQLTALTPVTASVGSSCLPGGILIKWGNPNVVSSGQTITFSTPFPNTCWVCTVTINNNNPASTATVSALSKTGFQIFTTKTGVAHFYIAIGN